MSLRLKGFFLLNAGLFVFALNNSAAAAEAESGCFDSCTADYYACLKVYAESDCVAQRAICTNLCGFTADRLHGAIAYSVSTGTSGFSKQYESRVQAKQRALQECSKYAGVGDCQVVSWFAGWCGALARSADGTWAASDGLSRSQARTNAVSECQKSTSQRCVVVTSDCSQ